MRALVTGATGFIGSYLTERLLGAGEKVSCAVAPDAAAVQGILRAAAELGGLLDRMAKELTRKKTAPGPEAARASGPDDYDR